MEQWIEEFLYRGRPPSGPGVDQPPAFHVVIGQQAGSPFDDGAQQRRTIGPMSLEAAEQAGWTLEGIVAALNAEAIKQCDALAADLAAAQGIIAERDAALDEMRAQLVDLSTEVSARNAEIERLSTLASQQQAVIEAASIAPAQD